MDERLDLPGEYEENREEVLAEFARKLKDDPKAIFYEEEEWIELADYALDINNRFLFAEAVIWGLASYPFSRELRDRETIFLSEVIDPQDCDLAFKTLASRPGASRVAQLLNYEIRNEGIIPQIFYSGIKKLMLTDVPIADHEIIEAMRVITDASALNYLLDDLAIWEKHVSYTQTLWYEIAANALDSEEYELGLKVIDKLLSQHPYNADYWLIKGRLALGAMNNEDNDSQYIRLSQMASEALDTAIAIRPNDKEAKDLLAFVGQEFGSADSTESTVSENTIKLFTEAVDSENKSAVKHFCRQIPLSWFNVNMNFMTYLSLEGINDDRSKEIIDSWIEYSLTRINTANSVNVGIPPMPANRSTLVSISEIFMTFNDLDSFNNLYRNIEKIAKKLKYSNPLDLMYAISCLQFDKKEFSKVYKKLEQKKSENILEFSFLTLLKDVFDGKKSMAQDAYFHLQRLIMMELEKVIFLKGAISFTSISPSILMAFARKLFDAKFQSDKD